MSVEQRNRTAVLAVMQAISKGDAEALFSLEFKEYLDTLYMFETLYGGQSEI